MAERTRLTISLAAGVIVGLILASFVEWPFALLLAWIVTAIVLVCWIWAVIGRMDPQATSEFATREDGSRGSTRALLLVASSFSLVGVLYALVRASYESGGAKWVFTVTGIGAVVISWALVHTLYVLRYAHLYYSEEPGGIDFKNDEEEPAYADFAYVAFTVGMTFQVSDTDIQSSTLRQSVLRQALLSYLFGTVIVATAINVIAGLVR